MGRKRAPHKQDQDQDRRRSEAERDNREREIDEALVESFPCSDPPATSAPGHRQPETSPDPAPPEPPA